MGAAQTVLGRRNFLKSAAATGVAAGLFGAGRAMAAPLPFRFACSAISWGTDIEKAIAVASRLGLPGLEPFRQNVVNYLDKPLELKKLFDAAHVQMVTCSNGGGPDFSGDFYDAAKTPRTIADHVKFAHDFILPFG